MSAIVVYMPVMLNAEEHIHMATDNSNVVGLTSTTKPAKPR